MVPEVGQTQSRMIVVTVQPDIRHENVRRMGRNAQSVVDLTITRIVVKVKPHEK